MKSPRGFTLIEVVVVLTVVSLLLSMGLRMFTAVMESQRRYMTREKLARIDVTLAAYVGQMKRLPCPADGALPASSPLAGYEQRGVTGDCLNTQQRGVVPWRTIGLAEDDITDGFFARLMYRAGPGLTRNGGMDISACDPAGSAAATSAGTLDQKCAVSCVMTDMTLCTSPSAVLANRGIEVRTAVGGTVIANPAGVPATGVAYVIVSHGPNRARGYSSDGVLQEDVGTVGDGEAQNGADQVLLPYYVDAIPDDSATTTHFDDFVSRPTILTVSGKAGLGPRAYH